MASIIKLSLSFGTDKNLVTIRQSNSSTPIIAGLLGVDHDQFGEIERVYLRNKIHNNDNRIQYLGWEPSGAISTILIRSKQETEK